MGLFSPCRDSDQAAFASTSGMLLKADWTAFFCGLRAKGSTFDPLKGHILHAGKGEQMALVRLLEIDDFHRIFGIQTAPGQDQKIFLPVSMPSGPLSGYLKVTIAHNR